MDQEQIISIVFAVLFAVSEMLGIAEKGPNSIFHLIFKIWGHDVQLDIDMDIEENGERIVNEDLTLIRPAEETALSDSLLRVYSKK